jgi:hypothetical protein
MWTLALERQKPSSISDAGSEGFLGVSRCAACVCLESQVVIRLKAETGPCNTLGPVIWQKKREGNCVLKRKRMLKRSNSR